MQLEICLYLLYGDKSAIFSSSSTLSIERKADPNFPDFTAIQSYQNCHQLFHERILDEVIEFYLILIPWRSHYPAIQTAIARHT